MLLVLIWGFHKHPPVCKELTVTLSLTSEQLISAFGCRDPVKLVCRETLWISTSWFLEHLI